jgi:hypothetical protein
MQNVREPKQTQLYCLFLIALSIVSIFVYDSSATNILVIEEFEYENFQSNETISKFFGRK